uniref:BRO1 domain-containing protein n=1 Tax=Ciona savignyi TaxID=51511 RepID=H2YHX1_CIOSA
RYHDQLVAGSRKFPFCEGSGVHVCFTWKDSLQKGKFLSSTPKTSISDGDFERLCVLYNIAALMSQIGSEANLQTDDGLKTAAKYFQESAGIFSYIKEKVLSVVGNNQSTTDLTVEVLNAYSCVMLGQAQECFYDKASSDPALNKKPEVLAKVAMQTSHLYSEAAKALVEADSSYSLGAVQSLCSAKKELFQCYAQHQQAKAANADKRFGEAIARYRVIARSLYKNSSELLVNFNGKQFCEIIGSEKDAAEKDNNFIYNDIIPKASSVPVIGKAPIAKAKAFNKNENLSMKFTDLFSSLVPLAVHNAVEAYSARRKELVDREIERIRELNNLINGVMSSFNLPAALEDMSGSDLPQSIIDKSRVVIDKGGVVPIDQLLQILPESLDRNQQILTEAKLFICFSTEHQSSDAELREKFGEKWRRKPSAELTLPLRQEMSKYQTIIENAQKADGIIRAKYTDNKVGIELLCLPVEKLKNAVPSSSPLAALKGHPVSLVLLKQLCEQVGTIKAEREVMETELRTTTYDMTDKFTRILAEEGCLNEDSISPKELNRIYQPLIEQVNDSGDRQESLLANLQVVGSGIHVGVFYNSSFDYHLGEEVLKTIAAAFDKYMELTAHLQEGNKFYGDLTELLLKLQPKCSDFVFARKTEKEELLKDLQKTILSGQPSEAPSVPAYHQQQDVYAEVKKPPARPPPPKSPGNTFPSQEQPPKPAPRNIPSQTPPTSVPPPTVTVASQNVPSAPQYTQRQDPYGYPTGAPHPGYTPYPVPGYGPPPGPAPYPQHLPYAYPSQPGYAPQGYPAYPPQPPQPGYPQPPYHYPPQ